jgi:hypothetical protein
MHKLSIIISFSFLIFLVGCGPETVSKLQPRKKAFAKPNQVIVVCDEELWNGNVGDSLRYYYESPFKVVPQMEPMFNLRYFSYQDLAYKNARKEMRMYLILADLNDEESPVTMMVKEDLGEKINEKNGVVVGKDKWADGQTIYYLKANGRESLTNQIINTFPSIAEKLYESQTDMLESYVYPNRVNTTLQNEVNEKIGANLRIPKEFQKAKENDNAFWLRNIEGKNNYNLYVQRIPYESEQQLQKEGMIAIRDQLGKVFTVSKLPGSHIETTTEYLPVLYQVRDDVPGYFVAEIRGLWEVEKEFLGGPFISMVFYKEGSPDLIFIDGYVYAPDQKKRDLIQRLEYILKHTTY